LDPEELRNRGAEEQGSEGEPGLSQLQRPKLVSKYAQACLEALSASGYGRWLSLGGAFGLAHYFEYRATHDIDAWWVEPVTREDRQCVICTLKEALRPFGQVHTHSWGDVVSVELTQQGRTVFSFQIARRSAQLEPSMPGPWPGILVDAFADLVASKMVALVERGAPRDFRDIYMLCQSGQCDVTRCWVLWRKRQQLACEDIDPKRAQLAIHTHLARIEQVRPLSQIADLQERTAAERLRNWFTAEFLHDLAD
jgi:hypothetical protein